MPDAFTTLTTRSALLGLRGAWLAPSFLTLPVAERIRAAILRITGPAASWQISGKDEQGHPRLDHAHLYILPASTRADGLLDRALLWANTGLLDSTRHVFSRLGEDSNVQFVGRPPMRIQLLGAGGGDPALPGIMARSHTWASVTPFVPPRFTKFRRGLTLDAPEDQLARLCELVVGSPPVEVRPSRANDWSRFVQQRMKDSASSRACSGWHLRFASPVEGPIALGLGAHFGLGRFDAASDPL